MPPPKSETAMMISSGGAPLRSASTAYTAIAAGWRRSPAAGSRHSGIGARQLGDPPAQPAGVGGGEQGGGVAGGGRVDLHGGQLERLLEDPAVGLHVLDAGHGDQRAADLQGPVADVD